MITFANESFAYQNVQVKMRKGLYKKALKNYEDLWYLDVSPDERPSEKELFEKLQNDLFRELESMFEYESKVDRIRIGFNDYNPNYSRFMELILTPIQKEEFTYEVTVEHIKLIQEYW